MAPALVGWFVQCFVFTHKAVPCGLLVFCRQEAQGLLATAWLLRIPGGFARLALAASCTVFEVRVVVLLALVGWWLDQIAMFAECCWCCHAAQSHGTLEVINHTGGNFDGVKLEWLQGVLLDDIKACRCKYTVQYYCTAVHVLCQRVELLHYADALRGLTLANRHLSG